MRARTTREAERERIMLALADNCDEAAARLETAAQSEAGRY